MSIIIWSMSDPEYPREPCENVKTVASIASSHMRLSQGKLGRGGGEEFMGVLEDTSVDAPEESAEDAFRRVDAMLYQAKARGRNRVIDK